MSEDVEEIPAVTAFAVLGIIAVFGGLMWTVDKMFERAQVRSWRKQLAKIDTLSELQKS